MMLEITIVMILTTMKAVYLMVVIVVDLMLIHFTVNYVYVMKISIVSLKSKNPRIEFNIKHFSSKTKLDADAVFW